MTTAQATTQNPLKQILKYGQSIWYDGLVSTKEFERMIKEDGIRGATTNPTILEKAIAGGEYDDELRGLPASRTDEEIYQTFAIKAVQRVADIFFPVFAGSRGEDGYVSIEVSPLAAYDAEATLREARELYRLVNRANVMIKIPATQQGLSATEAVLSEGINVNSTLIFSVSRYQEVMEVYLAALERRQKTGRAVSKVASVASFFVSRVDTTVDKILEEKIKSEKDPARADALRKLLGKAAIASCKRAYREFEKVFGGSRFHKLKTAGTCVQRPLWASTGTKNPVYSDVLYIEALMGPRTVNTAPPATLDAFRDHGVPGAHLLEDRDKADQTILGLQKAGISLNRVTQDLEQAGVRLFTDSTCKIIQLIREKRK